MVEVSDGEGPYSLDGMRFPIKVRTQFSVDVEEEILPRINPASW